MNPALIAALWQNVLIPEIAAIVRAHHNATGNLPTDAQVIAALDLDTTRYITLGESFLASKGIVSPPPGA